MHVFHCIMHNLRLTFNLVLEKCTDFGDCSKTCGGGTQTCENTCKNGNFGDTGCSLSEKTNSKECNPQACAGTK